MVNLLPSCMAFIQLRTFTVKVCEDCPSSVFALSDKQWDTSLSAICAGASAKGWTGFSHYSFQGTCSSSPAQTWPLHSHPLTCSPALVCPVCTEAPRSLHCSSSPPPPIDGQIPFSYDGCPWQQSVEEEATTLSAWPTYHTTSLGRPHAPLASHSPARQV